MGAAAVAPLAFPHPPRHLSEPMLRSRDDLCFISLPNGMRVPAVHISDPSHHYTIVYSHGNGEDIGLSLDLFDLLSQQCQVNVLAYEYPGYSISDGNQPSEPLCLSAIESALRYLTGEDFHDQGWFSSSKPETPEGPTHSLPAEHRVPLNRIVVFGHSLGSGPSVHIAAKVNELAGLILQSPLESGARCIMGRTASTLVYPFDIFRNYEKIGKVNCPVLIMHGERDQVVPAAAGRALAEILQIRENAEDLHYDPVFFPYCGHNDIPFDQSIYQTGQFLRHIRRKVLAS